MSHLVACGLVVDDLLWQFYCDNIVQQLKSLSTELFGLAQRVEVLES